MSKVKIYFVVPYPLTWVAGQRLRFEHFLGIFKQQNIEYKISPFFSEKFYKILYVKGNVTRKVIYTLLAYLKRCFDLVYIASYDIVFIYRETTPFRGVLFEWICKKVLKKKIIYDFDDAIFLPAVANANRLVAFLKNPSKVYSAVKLSDLVFVGNKYLAAHIAHLNSNIKILPTLINTDEYKLAKNSIKNDKEIITLGWIGSYTTRHYIEGIADILREVYLETGKKIKVNIIGIGSFPIQDIPVKFLPWRLESEIEDLSEIDIGLMPLTDDAWSWGKCGGKILQYMALGMPVVASPIGVNKEIIQDGENGFLALSKKEWVTKLSYLINDRELRLNMGSQARKTIVEKYSVVKYKQLFLDSVTSVR